VCLHFWRFCNTETADEKAHLFTSPRTEQHAHEHTQNNNNNNRVLIIKALQLKQLCQQATNNKQQFTDKFEMSSLLNDEPITVGYWSIRGLASPLRMMVMYSGRKLNNVMYDGK
jgi:hypothetical protein